MAVLKNAASTARGTDAEGPGLPTRPLGKTGLETTLFGLGGEGVLRTRGRSREAGRVIERALEQGVNYFDSAPAYADCLDYLGTHLNGRRPDVHEGQAVHCRLSLLIRRRILSGGRAAGGP